MTATENSNDVPKLATKTKSAYLFFCNDNRASVKAKDPKLGPKEVLSHLGGMWQKCKADGGDEYKKYVKLAEDSKAEFNQKKGDSDVVSEKLKKSKKQSVESEPVPEDKKPKEKKVSKKKVSKKKNDKPTDGVADDAVVKPPRPLNGYIKYLQASRCGLKDEQPSYTSKQITSVLADRWRKFSVDEKHKWKMS